MARKSAGPQNPSRPQPDVEPDVEPALLPAKASATDPELPSDPKRAMAILAALAQPTRFAAYRLLCTAGSEGMMAGAIARALGAPHNTMSTHLAILQRAGLIRSTRLGRTISYAMVPGGLAGLIGFLGAECRPGLPDGIGQGRQERQS